jgi:hypothetical protein
MVTTRLSRLAMNSASEVTTKAHSAGEPRRRPPLTVLPVVSTVIGPS